MGEKISITLIDCRDYQMPDKAFKVKNISNSIDYIIGQWLSVETVKDLCGYKWWEVKIIGQEKQ